MRTPPYLCLSPLPTAICLLPHNHNKLIFEEIDMEEGVEQDLLQQRQQVREIYIYIERYIYIYKWKKRSSKTYYNNASRCVCVHAGEREMEREMEREREERDREGDKRKSLHPSNPPHLHTHIITLTHMQSHTPCRRHNSSFLHSQTSPIGHLCSSSLCSLQPSLSFLLSSSSLFLHTQPSLSFLLSFSSSFSFSLFFFHVQSVRVFCEQKRQF